MWISRPTELTAPCSFSPLHPHPCPDSHCSLRHHPVSTTVPRARVWDPGTTSTYRSQGGDHNSGKWCAYSFPCGYSCFSTLILGQKRFQAAYKNAHKRARKKISYKINKWEKLNPGGCGGEMKSNQMWEGGPQQLPWDLLEKKLNESAELLEWTRGSCDYKGRMCSLTPLGPDDLQRGPGLWFSPLSLDHKLQNLVGKESWL